MKIRKFAACLASASAFLWTFAAVAQTPAELGPEDRAEIQTLASRYAEALGDCRAEDFADLFVRDTGYFASGFRGRMAGRSQLVALVESERHCRPQARSAQAGRPGGSAGPSIAIEASSDGVYGVADLGTAEYQDEYEKTPDGWRFASRTVVLAAEKDAGLDARDFFAIQQLGGPDLGDHYVADSDGPVLLNSGVVIAVSDGEITGRAWLEDGGYRDEVYERTGTGAWRVKSSVYVAPAAP